MGTGCIYNGSGPVLASSTALIQACWIIAIMMHGVYVWYPGKFKYLGRQAGHQSSKWKQKKNIKTGLNRICQLCRLTEINIVPLCFVYSSIVYKKKHKNKRERERDNVILSIFPCVDYLGNWIFCHVLLGYYLVKKLTWNWNFQIK